MPISFNSQSLALKLSRISGQTQSQLGNIYDQLSSGLRINRPSSDPAGQAVASGLAVNARVANRARLNINDGISLLNSAEGTLASSSDIISRLQELAEQAASGSLSSNQRSALATEFNQLSDELSRLKGATTFNNREILNGGPGSSQVSILAQATSGVAIKLSGDGRYLTYVGTGDRLIQKDFLTGAQVTISDDVSVDNLNTFDTDATGSTVVFASKDSQELIKYDRTTGQSTVLASFTYGPASSVAVSADGSRAAAVAVDVWSKEGASLGVTDTNEHVITVDLNSGQIHGDNSNNPYLAGLISSMALSPDGNYLAVLGDSSSFGYKTILFDAGVNTAESLLEESAGTEVDLAVSNSGTVFILTTANVGGVNPGGIANIISSDGSTSQNITNSSTSIQRFWQTDSGQSLTFLTKGNLTGENSSTQTQVFKYNAGSFTQQTANGLGGFAIGAVVGISSDGQTLITASGSNIYGVDARRQTSLGVETGTGSAGVISSSIFALDAAIRGLADLDISTARGAQVALDSLKMNERNLALARSEIGAGISRLEAAARVTEVKALTLNEARSKITDVDVAEGLAKSTRLQILSNAQVAIFAQATKLQPTIALQLLQ